MNRAKHVTCPVCKTKLTTRSFEAPQCPKCQTVFPNIFRQIQPALENGSNINLSFIHHVHLDELPLPSIIFQKLAESNTVEDLTFRRSRGASNHVLSVDACKAIEQLLEHQKKLWHFAFDCPVDPEGLPYISRGLSANQTLQEVDLSFSSVYEAEQLAKGIAANKSIKRMTLAGNLCSSEAVLKSFEELQHNESLVEVKLESIEASSDILACLKYLPASAKIKLSNVKLSNFTSAALEGLKHCRSSELEIAYSLDSASIGAVMHGLALNSTIKKLLILQRTELDNASAECVADLIAKNSTLAELSIAARESYNRYGYQPKVVSGFDSICHALQQNNSLTSLDLGIGISSNLNSLGDALLLNRTLKVLNLSYNNFAGSNLNKLCEALKVNVTLQSLNLSYCNLSRAAMINLSAALRITKALTDIDFSHHDHEFTYEMYTTLCDAIRDSTSLKKVVIGSCHNLFTHQGSLNILSHVAGIIKCNTNITSLSVLDHACQLATADRVPQFIEALKSNNTLTTLKIGPCVKDKALADIFASNYWLLESDICNGSELCKYLKRNLDYRKRVIANTMVLCENIFRSQKAMNMLPPELWMNVFAQLYYPGIGSMAPLVEQFIKYRNVKHDQQ